MRGCRVWSHGNRRLEVDSVWQSADVSEGTEHDWAVLLTDRKIRGDVGRLHAMPVDRDDLLDLVSRQSPVRLLYRYRPAAQGDCRLLPSPIAGPSVELLLNYSCRGYPGLSGSPVVVSLDGEPVVLGIHVGWRINQPGEVATRVSMARFVDAAILDALRAAGAQAQQRRTERR